MTPDLEPQSIVLGNAGVARVILGPPSAGHLAIRLQGRYVQAGDVVPLEPSLPGFFRDLGAGWRGWNGERRWASMTESCVIRARHDGLGHVSLIISLREPGMDRERVSEPWEASLGVSVDAAELDSIAARLGVFVEESDRAG